MPFKRQSSYLLTLAVAAAMSPSLYAAPADLWQCQTQADGSWQCAGSDTPAEPAFSDPANVPTQPLNTPEAVSQPESVNVSPAASAPAVAPAAIRTEDKQQQASQAAVLNAPAADLAARQLDWQPGEGGQCGRYVEPEYPVAEAGKEEEIIINADQSLTQIGQTSTMRGDIRVRQGNRTISSDEATLYETTNTATLQGNVIYREPGLLIVGDNAQANIDTSETRIEAADYVMHQQGIRGSAVSITRQPDSKINLQDTSYTKCPLGDESWKINADEVVLDPEEGFGTAKHATLRIGDVPVFYYPYFTFPIDDKRRSGFLYPTMGYSDGDGLELATPYYFNIAPNIDDTLTPHLYSSRGLSLDNELRYMNSYSYNVLSTAYLPNDRKADKDRWLVDAEHRGYQGNWRSTIDYTRVSDDDYFNDLNTGLEVNRQDHLDQIAQASYVTDNWTATTRVQSYQTITDATQPYRKLPQISLQGSQSDLVDGSDLELSYQADFTSFERDNDNLTGVDRVNGQRVHLQPSVSIPFRWPWAYVTPKATLWSSQYKLDDQVAGKSDSISRTVGVLSVDSGLSFERTVNESGMIQTLEPRLFALYVPEEDQTAIPNFDTAEYSFTYSSLFRENRFSGYDKIGDTQQLTLGLSSGFYRSNGSEVARLGIAQAHYFADREVQLESTTAADTSKRSNVALEASWNVTDALRISNDSELDASDYHLIENNLKFSYSPNVNKVFSLGFRDREDTREQADLSFIWPVAKKWSVLGRWQEDIRNNTTPEALLGVEYSDCCWQVRVAAREYLPSGSTERDSGIYIQFVLKGLGAFGQGKGLFDNITGFEEREKQNDY